MYLLSIKQKSTIMNEEPKILFHVLIKSVIIDIIKTFMHSLTDITQVTRLNNCLSFEYQFHCLTYDTLRGGCNYIIAWSQMALEGEMEIGILLIFTHKMPDRSVREDGWGHSLSKSHIVFVYI